MGGKGYVVLLSKIMRVAGGGGGAGRPLATPVPTHMKYDKNGNIIQKLPKLEMDSLKNHEDGQVHW